ncbi:Pentatricopeptide repeat-containing protein [Abeliophyllum distichum]|uniref:Pentatricopeptide repeat-containing protein n=1 Tax=Abeliophyllum distichum TaxID=126358 RepID=A0ABD1NNC2_9LAMI
MTTPKVPPLLNSTELISTIINLLKSTVKRNQNSPLHDTLAPFIPSLTPPIIHSVVSSPSLHHFPSILMSFLTWVHSHTLHSPPLPLPPLLSILSSLLSHRKFNDARRILQTHIVSDHPQHHLHRHLLHPSPTLSVPVESPLRYVNFSLLSLGMAPPCCPDFQENEAPWPPAHSLDSQHFVEFLGKEIFVFAFHSFLQ